MSDVSVEELATDSDYFSDLDDVAAAGFAPSDVPDCEFVPDLPDFVDACSDGVTDEFADALSDIAAEEFGPDDEQGECTECVAIVSTCEVDASAAKIRSGMAKLRQQLKLSHQKSRRQCHESRINKLEGQLVTARSNDNPLIVAVDPSETVQPLCTVMSAAVRTNVGDSGCG